MLHIRITVLALLATIPIATACSQGNANEPEAVVKMHDFGETTTAVGEAAWPTFEIMHRKNDGIDFVHTQRGRTVAKGAVVVTYSQEALRDRFDQLRTQYTAAVAPPDRASTVNVEAANKYMDEAEAAFKALLNALRLHTPCHCVVLEINATPMTLSVPPGEVAVRFAEAGRSFVRLKVSDRQVARIRDGNPVDMKLPGLSDLALTGTVDGVSLDPKQASRVRGASFGCASCHRADLAASTGLFCRLARG